MNRAEGDLEGVELCNESVPAVQGCGGVCILTKVAELENFKVWGGLEEALEFGLGEDDVLDDEGL